MNLGQIKTLIEAYLERADLATYLNNFVNFGIRKIETGPYNFKHMAVRTTTALAEDAYLLTNPISTYKQLISAFAYDSATGSRYPLRQVSLEYALTKYPDYVSDKDIPRLITEVADIEATLDPDIAPTYKLLIRPTADKAYTLELYGYQYSPEITSDSATNWWTIYHPELVVWAACCEAETFLKNDPRVDAWKAKRDERVKSLIDTEVKAELGKMPQYINSDYVV